MDSRVLGVPRTVWTAFAVVLALVIGVVSMLPPRGTPGPQIADLGETRALLLHALGYLLLALAAMLAQRAPRPVVTAIAIIGYGVVLELFQGLVGVRSAQVTDALANAAGAIVGVTVAALVLRRA